jgi:hypothetical protein
MPGITAIVNRAVAKDDSIQCFYNTNNLNLGVTLKSGEASGTDPEDKYVASSTDAKGIIVNPSHIGATYLQGLVLVAGITQPPLAANTTTYTKYDISIISPVYKPLTQTDAISPITGIATCSDGGSDDTDVWIYYLTGTDQDTTKLKEYAINNFNISEQKKATPLLGSSLAAYYDTKSKNRWVIYQDKDDKHLYAFKIGSREATYIDNSTDARTGTTIAVTYSGEKAYCYYTDSDYEIRRIVKDDTWGSSTGFSDASKVDANSQLTVVTSNNTNHLFYVADGDSEGVITHYRDSISSS